MFKIITKKEYNRLISQCKESVKVNDILIKKLDSSNALCRKILDKNSELSNKILKLRKQLLILTPNRDASTGRFIPKYNSKKNEKKQV